MRPRLRPNSGARLASLLVLTLLCGRLLAAGPPPFLVDADQWSDRITIYSEYQADPDANIHLDDLVSGQYDTRFQPATSARERLGYQSPMWWVRIALRNDSDVDLHRVLELAPSHFAQVTAFIPDGSGYLTSHAGSDQSPPWADIRDRRLLFNIDLPARSTRVLYLRARTSGSMNYEIFLSSAAAQVSKNASADLPYLLGGGLLLGLLLFNAGQFWLTRNRPQLYYLLTLFCILMVTFSASGFIGIQYLPVPGLQPRLELTMVSLGYAFSLIFTRRFLNIGLVAPVLDKLLYLLTFGCLALALLCLSLPINSAARLVYALVTLLSVPIIYAGIRAWQSNLPNARLYLLARSSLALSALVIGLNTYHVINVDMELPLIILLAAIFEGLLFTFGLTHQREVTLQQQLQQQQRLALEESTWQTRSETLSRVSHEIRTPMSGVLGMAELLADTPLTPNQKECVRSIRSAGENLLRIINDVLEYSRLEQGATDLNRENFDLSDLVTDALDLFRERAEEKQIEIIAHIHTNVPAKVEGDHGKLRQVLTNILGACIRHTSNGELVLDVSRDPSGLADHLRFEFEGSVMSQLQHQLDAFADSGDSDDTDGTKLGLTIARQLVAAMGGKGGLREGRRGNLVCWINLPLPASEQDVDAEVPVDGALLAGHSMLVVDDSSTVTRVIRQQALSWGMRVTVCHDPREALATIRTQANLNEPFDIVLLDHQMPGINGMQLAARIHEDALITHPLVLVMLTGVQDAPTTTAARNVGIHKVLGKPVTGQRLRLALAEALGMLSQQKPPEPAESPRRNLRILVAEDHLLSQKVIRGMLAKLGLGADIVANGRDAVNAVREGDYDIVLMDCEMPEMDGFEATRRIREWEQKEGRNAMPIIALTAHILREHRDRSLSSGMNAHVPKPIEIGALSDVIVRFTASVDALVPGSPHASDEMPG